MRLIVAIALALAGATVLAAPVSAAPTTPCSLDSVNLAPAPGTASQTNPRDAFTTAYNYFVTFYPRWFTFNQGMTAPCNQLFGSDQVTPAYRAVVAINNDTLYVSALIGVKKEPVIVTVPPTDDIYSVLHLDGYGNIIASIPSGRPGVYGLTGPDWSGTLPTGVIPIPLPYNYTTLIFRADRYSPTGKAMQAEAEAFRRGLHAAALSAYLANPTAGPALIVPVESFSKSHKLIADELIATDPIKFLTQLQTALSAGTTQSMTAGEQALSDAFNALFGDRRLHPQLINGVKAGFASVVSDYLAHTIRGSTWISFNNIGEWDKNFQGYLDRSAITEYLQFGNNHGAAAYYHTFLDGKGAPLDGHTPGYVLKFAKGQQPQARRFWSVTAYTPDAIELVPNSANKYLVARYTSELVTAPDGSVTILMSPERPDHFPEANWLPTPKGRFNIMLRAYGPEGSVLDNSYVPPPIERWTGDQDRR